MRLVLFLETFQIEEFAEVGIRFVGDVNEISLDEGFRRRRADLEGFEDGVDAGSGLGNSLEIAGWRGGFGGAIDGEEILEGLLEGVGIEKHLVDLVWIA